MTSEHEHQVPIWFFIGLVLTVYGVLILAYGLFGPPVAERTVQLAEYRADVWWGAILLVFGLVYTIKFRPGRT